MIRPGQSALLFRLHRLARTTVLAAAVALSIAGCSGGSGSSQAVESPDPGTPGTPGTPGDTGQTGTLPARPAGSTNITYEHARPERLWIVNPDNDSISVVDGRTGARLAEIAVAEGPRTIAFAANGEAWVTSRDAGVISVIDPTVFTVRRRLELGIASQPYGIVFSPADGSAWVGLAATGQIVRLEPTSGTVTARLDVGGEPRHLAITGTGDRLLVSRYITAPLPGESTREPTGTDAAGVVHGGEVIVIDPATASTTSRITLALTGGQDNATRSRGVPNYLGAAAIAPDNGSAWIPSKLDNVQRGAWRDSFALDFQSTVRAITSKVVLGADPVEAFDQRLDLDNSSVSSAAAFEPTGRYLFVALETSREIGVVDVIDGRESRRILAGPAPGLSGEPVLTFAPQGIAVSADGRQLAVNNVLSRAVALFDLSAINEMDFDPFPAPTMVTTVTREKLAADVLHGKQLFHDAYDIRLARDRYMSCASCHNEGGEDGRVWDLSSLGEGLRNTISLNGRSGDSLPLHWSANFDEVQDFEVQIRALAGGRGLLDDALFNDPLYHDPFAEPKAGLSADLDALAAYVKSLSRIAPSPFRNADRTLTASAVDGRALFEARGCASCHFGAQYAGDGAQRHDVGTLGESARPRLPPPTNGPAPVYVPLDGIDTPTLRDVWATAPYLHDGSAATVEDAIRRHTGVTEATELTRLADFVRQIGSEEPAMAPPAR